MDITKVKSATTGEGEEGHCHPDKGEALNEDFLPTNKIDLSLQEFVISSLPPVGDFAIAPANPDKCADLYPDLLPGYLESDTLREMKSLLRDESESRSKANSLLSLKDSIPYSPGLANLIIDKVLEGKRLTQVAALDGIPSIKVIYRWLRQHTDFREAYDYALSAKGLYAMDKVEELSEMAVHAAKDEVSSLRLAMDGYRFIAERHDRVRYGVTPPKADSGNTIIINTGIERDHDDSRTVSELIVEMQGNEGEV